MATYKLYYGVNRHRISGGGFRSDFVSDTDINPILSAKKTRKANFADNNEMRGLETDTDKYALDSFLLYSAINFSCRESLVYTMKRIVECVPQMRVTKAAYGGGIIYVDFTDYIDDDLSWETLRKFDDAFFTETNSKIRLIIPAKGRRYISLRVATNGYLGDFCTVSALLYMFRSKRFTEHVLKRAHVTGGLQELFKFLAKDFLEEDWGDSSNSSVALSLFSFVLGVRKSFDVVDVNGPVQMAYRGISPQMLIRYIREIYLPHVQKYPLRTDMYRDYPTSDDFREAFSTLLTLLNLEKLNLGKFVKKGKIKGDDF